MAGVSVGPRPPADTWGRYHGGRRLSSDDSLHSPTVIPPSALDKPSITKRYHRRRTCSHTSPRRSSTMVTLHDTGFVEWRWWNDGWTMKMKDRVFRQTVGAFLVRQKNAASSYSSSSSSSSLSTSSLPPPSSASFIHSFIHSFSSSYFASSSSTFDLLIRASAETQGVIALSRCLPGDLATLHVVTVPLRVTGLVKRVSEQGHCIWEIFCVFCDFIYRARSGPAW